jgi:hypothetical protein
MNFFEYKPAEINTVFVGYRVSGTAVVMEGLLFNHFA